MATSGSFAQQQLNSYKYIIVPKQFEVFKEQNQYKTSTLVKFLLENKGFSVVYDDDLPSELNANRCLGLLVGLLNNSTMFTTKINLTFKDCNSKIVYSSAEGSSKIKEFTAAYSEAIRDALRGLNSFSYDYVGTPEPVTISFKNDIQHVSPSTPKTAEGQEPSVQIVKTQIQEEREVVLDQISKAVAPENLSISKIDYYAQSIENGYQLVDNAPKIIMKMFKTSKPTMYLGEDINGNTGVVYAADGAWFFEYYQDGKLMLKILKIKF